MEQLSVEVIVTGENIDMPFYENLFNSSLLVAYWNTRQVYKTESWSFIATGSREGVTERKSRNLYLR